MRHGVLRKKREAMNDQRKYQPVNAAEEYAQARVIKGVIDHLVQMGPGTVFTTADLATWTYDTYEDDLRVIFPGFPMNGAYDIASRVFWRTGIGRELFDSSIVDGELVHVRRPA